MPFPYRRILSPIDFDENSFSALSTAAELAREHEATVYLLYVVPVIVKPAVMPVRVDLYQAQEEEAHRKLVEIARERLAGLKYELMIKVGEPAGAILAAARKTRADIIVMATHGRRGFKHLFLGSVAENVLREANCPVLTIRYEEPVSSRTQSRSEA